MKTSLIGSSICLSNTMLNNTYFSCPFTTCKGNQFYKIPLKERIIDHDTLKIYWYSFYKRLIEQVHIVIHVYFHVRIVGIYYQYVNHHQTRLKMMIKIYQQVYIVLYVDLIISLVQN